MSQWKRLSRKRRAFYLALALFVLGTAGWSSSQWIQEEEGLSPAFQAATAQATELRAPLPPPQQVYVQLRSNTDGLGNVFVLVQLSSDDLAAKVTDGTRDFVTIGNPDNQVLLRDDGAGGDATAGDGLFTGISSIDIAELEDKEVDESAEVTSKPTTRIPVFQGRTLTGSAAPAAFDISSFKGGKAVPLDPAVAFVDPDVGATSTFQERVLMIRSNGVVNDPTRTYDPCTDTGAPNGVWSFQRIAAGLANQDASGIDPSDLVERWLENWTSNRVINADTVVARAQMQSILDQWPRRFDGKLDLAKSPLRLLAIVPRLDLRTTTGGGGSYAVNTNGNFLDAGEARFVFGFVLRPDWKAAGFITDPSDPIIPNTGGCKGLRFTVIAEFRVPKCECEAVRDWARQWVGLASLTPGTAAYNGALEKLTEQFVRANANPIKPNGSALGQLRTNEVALAAPWELREFQLTQFPFTFLAETTVADTPEDAYNNNANGTGLLRNWILTVRQQLPLNNLGGAPIRPVPLLFGSSQSFLAGNALVPEANPAVITFHWNAPSLNLADTRTNWARHRVSLATCNGCHRRESNTPFVHIDPMSPGAPANISGFLTGISVSDPANGGVPVRSFDDLARRELDIKQLARLRCFHFRRIDPAKVQAELRNSGRLPADPFGAGDTGHLSVAVEDMKANHVSEVH